MRRIALSFAAVAVAAALLAPSAHAKAAYTKKAQEAGHKDLVANCQSCHKAKLPTAKAPDLNDTLGAFLAKKMKETGAKEMDFKWLKDYKPPAK
jgi:cytochrome c553